MNHEPAAEIGRSVLIWNLIEILPQLGRKDGQDRKATLHHQRGKRVSVQYLPILPYCHTTAKANRQREKPEDRGGEDKKTTMLRPCGVLLDCPPLFFFFLHSIRSWIHILSFLIRMEWMYVCTYVHTYIHMYVSDRVPKLRWDGGALRELASKLLPAW